jgi:hypothetical protein
MMPHLGKASFLRSDVSWKEKEGDDLVDEIFGMVSDLGLDRPTKIGFDISSP